MEGNVIIDECLPITNEHSINSSQFGKYKKMTSKELKQKRKETGKVIESKRKEKGMTYYALAKKTGTRIDQVQNVESGKSNYGVDILNKICNGLGLKITVNDNNDD